MPELRISDALLVAGIADNDPMLSARLNLKSAAQKAVAVFPILNPTGICAVLLPLAVIVSMVGTFDTARNMRERWNLYHARILLPLYADLTVITLLVFMTLFPLLLSSSRGIRIGIG